MKIVRVSNPLVILLALPLVLVGLVLLGVLMVAGAVIGPFLGPLFLARKRRVDLAEPRRPATGAIAKDVFEAEFQRLPGQ